MDWESIAMGRRIILMELDLGTVVRSYSCLATDSSQIRLVCQINFHDGDLHENHFLLRVRLGRLLEIKQRGTL